MKSELFKNQCQKPCFLWHRLFRVLDSILEGLRPPSWSQIGRLRLPGPFPKPSKSNLLDTFCQDASQEVPKWLQRAPKEGPEVDFQKIFDGFGKLFRYFWQWKLIISTKTPGVICTSWVTPSLEKYKLSDFKPHVQLEFKFKNNSILHGASAQKYIIHHQLSSADIWIMFLLDFL